MHNKFFSLLGGSLLTATLYLFPIVVFFTQQDFSDGVMLFWAVCFLLLLITKKFDLCNEDKFIWYYLAILIGFLIIHVVSFLIDGVAWHHGYYFRLMLIVPIYLLLKLTKVPIQRINYSIILTIMLSLLVGLYQVLVVKTQRAGFPVEFNHGYYPINWGDTLLILGVYIFLYQAYYRPKYRQLYVIAGIFGLICSILSGSRGGMAGLPIVLIIIAFSLIKNVRWRWLFILSLIVSLPLIITLCYKYNLFRIASAYNDLYSCFRLHQCLTYANGGDNSLGLRIMMWKNAWLLFTSHPLFGVGVGGFTKTLIELANNGTIPDFFAFHYNEEPHSEIFRMLAMFGIVGFVGYILVLFFPFLIIRPGSKQFIPLLSVMVLFFCAACSQALLIAPIACDLLVFLIAISLYQSQTQE